MTGIPDAHIVGEHLCLPGYGEDHPTLEIFGYNETLPATPAVNRQGLAHLAFEVGDVEAVLRAVLAHGGGQVGEVVHAQYPDGRSATFVYATDCEGNILELQSWT